MSEEAKAKIRLSKKGKGNGRLGTKHTEETKQKMREKALLRDNSNLDWTGRKHSDSSKLKISEANVVRFKNSQHPLTNFKFSDESKKKMSESHLGKILSKETRSKISESHTGDKHWNWKGGITSLNRRSRSTSAWKTWREQVFKRDDYTCQECFKNKCYLEPHHIIPVRSDRSKLFTLTNGVSLCRPCHKKTIWKEHLFEEKYLLYTNSKKVN